MSTSTLQPGTAVRTRRMVSAKMAAPPSGRSSRVTEVITAYFSCSAATASATRRGSSRSCSVGCPLSTAQKAQRRVQVLPRMRKVAVRDCQHSPMFGQRALSHTVCSRCARTSPFNSVYPSPRGAGTFSHAGRTAPAASRGSSAA